MELILVFMIAVGSLFVTDNKQFFDTAEEQINQGAEWHYVGKSPLRTVVTSRTFYGNLNYLNKG